MTPVVEAPRKVGRPSLCYTTNELCAIWSTSDSTLHRWREQGIIPFVKIGGAIRYPKAKIDPILKRQGIIS